MKLNATPRISGDPVLVRELREHATMVNLLSDGRVAGTSNASTAAPTTGLYAQGDFVRNSAPAELGAAGNKYVIVGWLNVQGGEPGTFVACRCLTGN